MARLPLILLALSTAVFSSPALEACTTLTNSLLLSRDKGPSDIQRKSKMWRVQSGPWWGEWTATRTYRGNRDAPSRCHQGWLDALCKTKETLKAVYQLSRRCRENPCFHIMYRTVPDRSVFRKYASGTFTWTSWSRSASSSRRTSSATSSPGSKSGNPVCNLKENVSTYIYAHVRSDSCLSHRRSSPFSKSHHHQLSLWFPWSLELAACF